MANQFNVSSLVAKIIAEFYVQTNNLYRTANKKYVKEFKPMGYATGGTIQIKVPSYPIVTRGLQVTPTGVQDLIIPFTITTNDIYNVTRDLNFYEEIFDIVGGGESLTSKNRKEVVDNYGYPAYQAIAGQIEAEASRRLNSTAYLSPIDGIEKLGGINTYSAISELETMAQTMKYSPARYLLMNQYDCRTVTDSLQNMFNPDINGIITKNARVLGKDKGSLAGFDVWRSTEIVAQIAGPEAGNTAITVSNVATDGSTITLTGVAAQTSLRIKQGDRISIPSVHIVSPVTYTGTPYRLVVTAANDAFGDGAGNVQVTLSYPLLVSGEHQNVDSLPAIGAPAAVFPSHNNNYAYVESGLSVVPLPLPKIRGAENSENSSELEVPVHCYIQGLVQNGDNIVRISNLTGIRAFAPYILTLPSALPG